MKLQGLIVAQRDIFSQELTLNSANGTFRFPLPIMPE